MKKTFGVIGGDRRQAELARLLTEDGYVVYTYGLLGRLCGVDGFARAVAADVVILPLPLCKGDGVLNCEEAPMPVADLFRHLNGTQLVLAGQVKPKERREAEACGLHLEDYFLREELTVANAAVTAEAAMQVALDRLDRALLGTDCLVLGFGRIGKLLAHRLHGIGAHVTATARKPEDLAWIRAYGWQAMETGKLDGKLGAFDVVFNTIPSPVLNRTLLQQLPKACLCVDLASNAGIDLEAATELGLPNTWARSLPGRLMPRTAAAVIRDAIDYIMEERGDPA